MANVRVFKKLKCRGNRSHSDERTFPPRHQPKISNFCSFVLHVRAQAYQNNLMDVNFWRKAVVETETMFLGGSRRCELILYGTIFLIIMYGQIESDFEVREFHVSPFMLNYEMSKVRIYNNIKIYFVNISAPLAVITTVCSKCAEFFPSFVYTLYPSPASSNHTSFVPTFTIGSIA